MKICNLQSTRQENFGFIAKALLAHGVLLALENLNYVTISQELADFKRALAVAVKKLRE